MLLLFDLLSLAPYVATIITALAASPFVRYWYRARHLKADRSRKDNHELELTEREELREIRRNSEAAVKELTVSLDGIKEKELQQRMEIFNLRTALQQREFVIGLMKRGVKFEDLPPSTPSAPNEEGRAIIADARKELDCESGTD